MVSEKLIPVIFFPDTAIRYFRGHTLKTSVPPIPNAGDIGVHHGDLDHGPVPQQGGLHMYISSLGTIHILRKHFFYQPQHFYEFFEHFSLCTKDFKLPT